MGSYQAAAETVYGSPGGGKYSQSLPACRWAMLVRVPTPHVGFGAWGLGFRVWGLGFGVLGVRVFQTLKAA